MEIENKDIRIAYIVKDSVFKGLIIEECEIIKETPKTYVVNEKESYCNSWTVRKSTMNYGCVEEKILCLSYEEAQQKLIEMLKQKIIYCQNRIKINQENIKLYENLLKEYSDER